MFNFEKSKLMEDNKIIIQHDLGKNWPINGYQMNAILNEVGYRIRMKNTIIRDFPLKLQR